MENLTPEQATFLMQRGVLNAQNEHRSTKKIVEAIPLDKDDYRPDRVSMSAFAPAKPIAGAQNPFVNGAAAGKFDFTAKMPDSPQFGRSCTMVRRSFSKQYRQDSGAFPGAITEGD